MVKDRNPNRWVKCLSTQGSIRGVAIQATELVQRVAAMHHLKGRGAQGLGEALIGALQVASYCKKGERINLNIQGSGFFHQALVDAHPEGTVRGYVIERSEPLQDDQSDDKQGPWGAGLLSVLRTKGNESGQPYIGTVPLLTGHLAKDLSLYWVQSEQIPSAVGITVGIKDGEVVSAGGFLVQALPGASEAEVKAIEQHIHEIQSLAEQLTSQTSPITLLGQIFQSTAFMVVEERPLEFVCQCTWDRVERALTLVGYDELQKMWQGDDEVVVRCDFCTKEYHVGKTELEKLMGIGGSKVTD